MANLVRRLGDAPDAPAGPEDELDGRRSSPRPASRR
jgi:hypothetical protein